MLPDTLKHLAKDLKILRVEQATIKELFDTCEEEDEEKYERELSKIAEKIKAIKHINFLYGHSITG